MVRTSRSAATTTAPASMDDIDLDVMFAADGDELFDGLDIDLDMDDIAGGAGGGNSNSGALDASNRSNTSSFNRRVFSRPQTQRPKSPDDENGEDELSRTRRKTKRKAKTPSFFEDDDDDYDEAPANKKKRKSSSNTKAAGATAAALAKKKSTAKVTQDDILITAMKPPTSTPKAKSKSAKSSSSGMPPPLARTGPWVPTSSSSNGAQHVAAAGQFGNRQKQRPSGTSFPSLPKGGGAPAAGAVSSNQGGRIINKLPLSRSSNETSTKSKSSTQQQQHKRLVLQPESTYCGLQPSPTHFYPFMPALPTEPVLKSRKVYGSIDRIHTSLVGYLHTPPTASSGIVQAKENEPLFLLLQEAFKEEKSGAASLRLESIGISIGELRQTITAMDKNRIISDWYGVCALIKRQHDFLKQNCENMERWCRDNFSKEDFAEVYAPSKKRKDIDGAAPLSVLKTFKKREIKVKISFTGLKDPKMPAYVLAVFPPLFLPNELTHVDDTESKLTTNAKKKSQTTPSLTSLHDGKAPELISPSSKIKPPQPLSYVNMKPPRRRRNVAEMITRTARELSKTHSLRIEMSRKSIDRREAELEKIVYQDSTCGIHTAAMWKWVELSGFLTDFTMQDVEDSLQDIRSVAIPLNDDIISTPSDQMQSISKLGEGVNVNASDSTVYDRLQSLLVDVQPLDDDENGDSAELVEFSEQNADEVCSLLDFVDLSSFTVEERACIVLHSFGLTGVNPTESASNPVTNSNFVSLSGCSNPDQHNFLNGNNRKETAIDSENSDLDDLIGAMKSELVHVEERNDERVAYLESVSSHYRRLKNDQLLQSDREAGLIAKCQQLLRKSKELKAKSGASIKKDDSLALPW